MPSQRPSPHFIENICIARLDAFSEALLSEPVVEDPEYVHQLRVATRRIRACLVVFKPVFNTRDFVDAHVQIHIFAQALGEARDNDVYVLFLTKMLRSKRAVKCGNGIVFMRDAALKAQKRSYKKVLTAVKRMRQNTAIAGLKKTLLKYSSCRTPHKLPSAAFLRYTIEDAMKEVVRHEKAACRTFRDKKLHSLRIALKHLRYTVEMSYAQKPRSFESCLAVLKRAQDMLGDIHDYHQWGAAIRKIRPVIVSRLQDASYLDLSYRECNGALRFLKKYLRKRRKKEILRFRKFWKKSKRKKLLGSLLVEK